MYESNEPTNPSVQEGIWPAKSSAVSLERGLTVMTERSVARDETIDINSPKAMAVTVVCGTGDAELVVPAALEVAGVGRGFSAAAELRRWSWVVR